MLDLLFTPQKVLPMRQWAAVRKTQSKQAHSIPADATFACWGFECNKRLTVYGWTCHCLHIIRYSLHARIQDLLAVFHTNRAVSKSMFTKIGLSYHKTEPWRADFCSTTTAVWAVYCVLVSILLVWPWFDLLNGLYTFGPDFMSNIIFSCPGNQLKHRNPG